MEKEGQSWKGKREKERDREGRKQRNREIDNEVFQLLVHSPHAHKIQCQAISKPGIQNSMQHLTWVAVTPRVEPYLVVSEGLYWPEAWSAAEKPELNSYQVAS